MDDACAFMVRNAAYYLTMGWRVVPVLWRGKAPGWGGVPRLRWQDTVVGFRDVATYFSVPSNIGVLLGTPSGGLADIDLDCAEAVELAPHFLPSTWTFGRGSKPRSHWVYVAAGAKTAKFLDVKNGDGKAPCLLELRADKTSGSESAGQTVFPPSVHVSGEPIEWTDDNDAQEAPRIVDADELLQRAGTLAAACLALRHAGRAATYRWIDDKDGRVPFPRLPPAVMARAQQWMRIAVPVEKYALHPADNTEDTLRAATDAYRHDRPAFERRLGKCPACDSPDGFKALDSDGRRWACFSSRHDATGVGHHGDGCWIGDALDLDAHAEGVTRVQLLRKLNYLQPWERKHG